MAEIVAPKTSSLNNDEKMFALFAHLSIFFGGIILPLIFWAINKDKSKFVSFHSLQALFFHITFAAIMLLVVLFLAFGFAGISIIAGSRSHNGMPIVFLIIVFAIYGLMFLLAAGAIIYSIYMAVKAYGGKLNKYPIIGNLVYKKVYVS